MTVALALGFAGFALVSSITPGPNNTMLLASGVNYGFRRSLPHVAGITLGCVVMLLLVAVGLGAVFTVFPIIAVVLRYVGAAYLVWLAWKIARARPADERLAGRRPLTIVQAAAFQWVNPKAWIIVIGAVSTYAPAEELLRNVALLAVLFGLVNAPSASVWAGCGTALRPLLSDPRRLRIFNVAMALLLVASLWPILAE
jgi:threonine/homoserine/homoserine lactone efflux protein